MQESSVKSKDIGDVMTEQLRLLAEKWRQATSTPEDIANMVDVIVDWAQEAMKESYVCGLQYKQELTKEEPSFLLLK